MEAELKSNVMKLSHLENELLSVQNEKKRLQIELGMLKERSVIDIMVSYLELIELASSFFFIY
jgi:hypothetical protein